MTQQRKPTRSKKKKASTVSTKTAKPKSKKPSQSRRPKKKAQSKASPMSAYARVRGEVEKAIKDRTQIRTSRGSLQVPRRYHLTDGKMTRLIEATQKSGQFPNPYRRNGIYYALVQSLVNLGMNEVHPFNAVKAEIKKILSKAKTRDGHNAWEAFASRKSRNELSGKDINGRILQNAMVLQRLTGNHPYGEKLRQLKCCVDVLKADNGMPQLRLNTKFKLSQNVSPINDMKRPRRGQAKAKEEKAPETKITVSEQPPEQIMANTEAVTAKQEPAATET